MPYLQLTVDIGESDPGPYEEVLFALGAVAVTLQDSADDPILEPAPGATPLWPTVTVQALFDSAANADDIVEALVRECGQPRAQRVETIEDRAWEREWLKEFRPMRFGARVWVCPGGMRPEAQDAGSQDPVIVELDPGLAFGTGTHPTTALCLTWLDGAELQGRSIIDYGCGSGILAIAALKLGARTALCTDIDPQAMTATHANALRNNVAEATKLKLIDAASVFKCDPADVVLANILAGPLHELAPALTECVKAGGQLVLSGVLAEQAAALVQRYNAWFDMDEPTFQDNWARLTGRRRS